MEKLLLSSILLFATLFLTSCGNSISKDAQEVADLQCKAKNLQLKAISGDTSSMEDAQEFMTEASRLIQKMDAKYSSLEEKQKFKKALLKASANCN
ncbi:hypothetical protein [Hyunsoonleella ulvae]|uniref:hypothetical protein n=1 Tax=Hyunsoonleella ulvae TaxID=2799948 RepID=UPI001939D2B9|nr:hypothetical protein [Hyunsoonleella ulvae]